MPSRKASQRILFAGYAPVHFVCFRPLYERLRRLPGVEVVLSGGREAQGEGAPALTAKQLYAPFRLPPKSIIELDRMREQTFDIVFCAHVSGYFPKDEQERVQIFHGVSFRNMAVRRDVLVYDRLMLTGP